MEAQGQVQVNTKVPAAVWRPFKSLLALRGQSFTRWLVDHIQATLDEDQRRHALLKERQHD